MKMTLYANGSVFILKNESHEANNPSLMHNTNGHITIREQGSKIYIRNSGKWWEATILFSTNTDYILVK